MLVTDLPSIIAGMVNAPDAFLSQPVIVTVSPAILSFIGLAGASSVGLTSSLGTVGFSLTDSEPSDDDFSPQPATSSAANSRTILFIAPRFLAQPRRRGQACHRRIEEKQRHRAGSTCLLPWPIWSFLGRRTSILALAPSSHGIR